MTNYIERYWRDATPEDAIKDPPMVARFRDPNYSWKIEALRGIRQGAAFPWFSESKISFQQCQVYDAPDPGEGWRLIDPNTEPLQEGDEFMLFFDRKRGWIHIDTEVTNWAEKNFYRRRIEPPKPKPKYAPFTWEDREQLRGRWMCCVDAPKKEWAINSVYIGGGGELRANGIPADLLLKQWTFTDTGEPVGKRVQ